MPQHQRLTIFKAVDDLGREDFTPLIGAATEDANGRTVVSDPSFSTDPAHARPWLLFSDESPSQEIDFFEGSSVIGAMTARVLDKRRTPTDQATGFVTFEESAADGTSNFVGRRFLFEQQDAAGAWYVLIDGVCIDYALEGNDVVWRFPLRDIRQRELKTAMFTNTQTTAIMPRGVVGGYGRVYRVLDNGIETVDRKLVPDVGWAAGNFYRSDNALTPRRAFITMRHTFAPEAEPFGMPETRYDDLGNAMYLWYPNVVIRWKLEGGAVIHEYRQPRWHNGAVDIFGSPNEGIGSVHFWDDVAVMPANAAMVRVQVLYIGPPTEAFPAFIDERLGETLRKAYDGLYSDPEVATRVRYDTAAMNAFIAETPMTFFPVPAVVEDMRAWVQEHIYKPMGAVPALAPDGRITPIRWRLPDANDPLLVLNDNNTRDASWARRGSQAVTRVEFTYTREYVATASDAEKVGSNAQLIQRRPVTIIRRHLGAAALLGNKALTYAPTTIRTIGTVGKGESLTPENVSEMGERVALSRAYEALDRFAFGAEEVELEARRGDATVAAARVGDWAIVACANLPNTQTHVRGSNLLAQVVSIQDRDPVWRSMKLVSAGPYVQPLAQPTLALAPTITADERVSIAVTAVPVGATVVVEYAIAAQQPAARSGDWLLAGRTDVAATIVGGLVPKGQRVWVQARSTARGRISSAPTAAVSVARDVVPELVRADLSFDPAGVATVTWQHTQLTAGVRVYYAVTNTPVLLEAGYVSSVSVAAADGRVVLPAVVAPGQYLNVEVQPWSQFPIAGVMGPVWRRNVQQVVTTPRPPEIQPYIASNGSMKLVLVGDGAAATLRYVVRTNGTVPSDTEVQGTAGRTGPVAVWENVVTLEPGQRFTIVAFARNAAGAWSERALYEDTWVGIGTQFLAQPVIGAGTPAQNKVSFTLAYDDKTVRLLVWYSEYASNVGLPTTVFNLGTPLVNPPHRDDGRAAFDVPVVSAGNWLVVTTVGVDALGRYGPRVNRTVQSLAAAPTAPPAPTAVVVATNTSSLTEVDVTMPADVTNVASLRTYRDGIAYGSDVARTAIASAQQRIGYAAVPGETHEYKYKSVTSGGIESDAFSPAVSATTPQPPAYPTPNLFSLTWDDAQQMVIASTVEAGDAGEETELWHGTATTGPYTVQEAAAGATVQHLHARTGVAQVDYVVVRKRATGFAWSAFSNERSVNIPA